MFIRQFRRRLLLSSSCAVRLVSLAPFFPTCHSRLGVGGGNGDSEGLPSSFPPLSSPVSFTSLPSCYSQDHPFLPLLSFSSFSFQGLCSRKNYSWRGKSTFGAFFLARGNFQENFRVANFPIGTFRVVDSPNPNNRTEETKCRLFSQLFFLAPFSSKEGEMSQLPLVSRQFGCRKEDWAVSPRLSRYTLLLPTSMGKLFPLLLAARPQVFSWPRSVWPAGPPVYRRARVGPPAQEEAYRNSSQTARGGVEGRVWAERRVSS